MNTLEEGHLYSAARLATAAEEAALLAGLLLNRGDVPRAEEAMQSAARSAGDTARRLRAAGVPAAAFDGVPTFAPVSLDQLDTPEARALLDGVRALLPLAERVDRARGRYSDAPEGQPSGDDTAETLFMLACRLGLEIYGPSAGGRE